MLHQGCEHPWALIMNQLDMYNTEKHISGVIFTQVDKVLASHPGK